MKGQTPVSDRSNYGWVIVIVATLALVISNGLSIGGLPPFYKAIREEFIFIGAVDATHAETFISNGATITFLMSGIFSMLGGWLLSRVRLKVLMIVGCVMLGGGLLLHSRAMTVEMIYFARFLMGASLGFVGVMPNVVLVSNWFRTNRGTALGIVLTGTSIGGVLIPLVAAPMIASYGWRTGMLSLSALVWFCLLPVIFFLVKETPDSEEAAEAVDSASAPDEGLTLGQAIRTPLFWLFGTCAALVFYPIFATSQQFILYLQSPKIGVTAEMAAFAQSALFAVSIAGKFLAGFLSDKLTAVRMMIVSSLVMFLASLVLLNLTAANSLLFLLPFALGYGGTFVLLQRVAADFFGRREIGKILGTITMIEIIGASVGGRITGYLADGSGGDYTHAFYGVTIAAALAFLATLAIFALAKDRKMNVVE